MTNWNTSIYVFSFKFNFKLTTGVAVKLGPLNPTIHHLFHLEEKQSLRNQMGITSVETKRTTTTKGWINGVRKRAYMYIKHLAFVKSSLRKF